MKDPPRPMGPHPGEDRSEIKLKQTKRSLIFFLQFWFLSKFCLALKVDTRKFWITTREKYKSSAEAFVMALVWKNDYKSRWKNDEFIFTTLEKVDICLHPLKPVLFTYSALSQLTQEPAKSGNKASALKLNESWQMIKMSSKYLVDIAYRVLLSSTSHIRKHSSSLNNTFLCSDIPESVEKTLRLFLRFT